MIRNLVDIRLSLFLKSKINSTKMKMEMTIFYDDIQIGIRRVDFFVEDMIMVELKAVSELNDSHLNQAINYLEAYNLSIGLLINFGSKSLTFKRVYNTNHPDNKNQN
ncbi:GxxExxY protein [Pedobacter sp. Leaf250]|uniref:GxxExxY protein n=1 Tax=Pedobacter sp. Leaf250 TaxID=2876559 RepID=UPI002105D6EB|nr:GxxExxY protein [Pedobacter sp. Leaf250]